MLLLFHTASSGGWGGGFGMEVERVLSLAGSRDHGRRKSRKASQKPRGTRRLKSRSEVEVKNGGKKADGKTQRYCTLSKASRHCRGREVVVEDVVVAEGLES